MIRIKASILEAKARGASLRVGSELEVCSAYPTVQLALSRTMNSGDSTNRSQICGYGCLDHFLEDDIYTNSWHMLLDVLEDDACHGILLDIGMPVKHGNQRLNW